MNIDFALPASGANARRLLHISELCKISIDDRIKEIALQGLISQEDEIMPLEGIRLAAAQFILDCEYRCAIPRLLPDIDRHLILDVLTLGGYVGPITVVGATLEWKSAFRAFGFHDTTFVSLKNAFLPENQDGRRDGILILDWTLGVGGDGITTALAKEFPKTIMFSDTNIQHGFLWWEMGAILFPEMPYRVFTLSDALYRRTMNDNWKTNNRDHLAIFYNVFLPHFVDILGYYQAK